ncbi:hypothetical protein VNI00_017164 [Paramarasmius palmivorus]|uniref:O-fucosyltransferase family protein n=1 Tax=Paramarasmius palmivorus TaxID=297713 RepID=A0AAW0B6W0_9AGAR
MIPRLPIPQTTFKTRIILRLCLVASLFLILHKTSLGLTNRYPGLIYTINGTSPVNFQFETVFGLGGHGGSCYDEDGEKSHLAVKNLVNGPPARSFRGNLKDDRHYLTTWVNAGLTNEFMGMVNMIYLAMLSDRIPVIPPFAPEDHISENAGYVAFGDVFDLERYRNEVGQAVLEWRDIKKPLMPYEPTVYATANRRQPGHPHYYGQPDTRQPISDHSSFVDTLGCWSTRARPNPDAIPAHSFIEGILPSPTLIWQLNLDVSYTLVPPETRYQLNENGKHVVFAEMAALLYPPAENPKNPKDVESYSWQADVKARANSVLASPSGREVPPDEHLACLDMSYFMTSGVLDFEWAYAWAPAWKMVGRHLRFREDLNEIARGYLRRAFQLEDEESIPPFIAVHIRRGDFVCHGEGECDDTPMDIYGRVVEQVKDELLERKGVRVEKVILASDETSQSFWDEVHGMGWDNIDHSSAGEDTMAKYGEWYLPIMDIVIQSLAKGFVGSPGSTFSMVSGKRVEEWNGGIHKTAFWYA